MIEITYSDNSKPLFKSYRYKILNTGINNAKMTIKRLNQGKKYLNYSVNAFNHSEIKSSAINSS